MYAPGTFTHDDESKAVVMDAAGDHDETKAVVMDAAGDPIESIRTAVEACPTGALMLSEEGV